MPGSATSSRSLQSKDEHHPSPSPTPRSGSIDKPKPYTRFRKPSLLPLRGPTLENLTLVNILNNETCSPISFKDFSTFITEKEHTTENLLFVIWYRSYEARWKELKENVRERVPVPSTRLGDRYDPFRRRSDTISKREEGGDVSMLSIGEQPMREEAARAFSTFLRSGGSRALGVSDDLRRFARTCLAKSSAPECVGRRDPSRARMVSADRSSSCRYMRKSTKLSRHNLFHTFCHTQAPMSIVQSKCSGAFNSHLIQEVTDEQVLCRRYRLSIRSPHLPRPHSSPTDNKLRLPRNPSHIYHLHLFRLYAGILRLERILLASVESNESATTTVGIGRRGRRRSLDQWEGRGSRSDWKLGIGLEISFTYWKPLDLAWWIEHV